MAGKPVIHSRTARILFAIGGWLNRRAKARLDKKELK